MCDSLLVTYFSKKGINNSGIRPPNRIPKAADRMVGSSKEAIISARICAITAPIIPAIWPFVVFLINRL